MLLRLVSSVWNSQSTIPQGYPPNNIVSFLFRQQTEQATQKLAKETTSYFKQLPHLYGESPSDRVCLIHYYYFNLVILYWIYCVKLMQIHRVAV